MWPALWHKEYAIASTTAQRDFTTFHIPRASWFVRQQHVAVNYVLQVAAIGPTLPVMSAMPAPAYCEIDARCRHVLAHQMRNGMLNRAPIFTDVTQLSPEDVRSLEASIITAGFPCQDVSRARVIGAGVTGSHSRLVFEIFRLMDALPNLKCVLLENSPNILTRGVELVVEPFDRRLWSTSYSVFDAREVGALHARKHGSC